MTTPWLDLILRLVISYREVGLKDNHEQIGHNLDATEVSTNNFSLLRVKYQFICQEWKPYATNLL